MNKRINYQGKMSIIANQYKKEKEYWLQKIAAPWLKSNFPYDIQVSSDQPASAGKTFETANVEFAHELFIKLMEISKRSDHTLYVILMAGLVSLLDKYTGNKDIIVGAPIFKQRSQGEFINTVLAIRSRLLGLAGTSSFKQLLLEVRESVVTANENMNFPIEILLHLLDIPYKENEDFPLFDTVILLENIHEKSYLDHINVNMIFSFQREAENIRGTLQYNPRLYNKAAVQIIISHYTHWLHRVLLNLDQPLSAIDILLEEEREKLLYTFNNTQADYPGDKTIHQLFKEQVAQTPDYIALHGGMDAWRHGCMDGWMDGEVETLR
ncbi:MAG: condensation domain-containing protein, partial [Acidobacteria bacterium]|nr:condensation domain-containing protein [Acidobacteriota bacterium]